MKKILLVEDDKWLSQMYGDAFEGASNISVDVAANADEVFELLDKNKYDLVLLDLFLPSHSGVELLHEIVSYEDTFQVPVMILSSVSPNETAMEKDRWVEYGVVDYLYKPKIKPDYLVAHVKKFFTSLPEEVRS